MYVMYRVFLTLCSAPALVGFSEADSLLPGWHKEIAHAYFFCFSHAATCPV